MQFVHQWFEFHVKQRPKAVALVFNDESLTYFELNRLSNRLARRLRDFGVGPDSIVAVGFDRGPDLIISILAVLKAGGAYLPLDPAYPADRLAFMLDDSPELLRRHSVAIDEIEVL